MKTRYCDECKHKIPFLIVMKCAKGHKPRFYIPRSDPRDTDWGWKRKCEDFEKIQVNK